MARDDDIAVPMRDGVQLLADVHRPATPGRYPVLIAASPYPRQIQNLGAPMGVIVAGARPTPIKHQVVIDGVRLEPQELTVKVGDAVVWITHDPFPNTATAVDKQFDSHEIEARRSCTYTPTKAGVFACTLHPTMLGTLRVELNSSVGRLRNCPVGPLPVSSPAISELHLPSRNTESFAPRETQLPGLQC